MLKIKYEKTEYNTIEHEFEFENDKYCFISGNDTTYNRTEFFGIYTNNKGNLIVATINDRKINFDWWCDSNGHTSSYIKEFLSKHKNCKNISDKTFFQKLDNLKSILKERD